jgi:competence protein ComEC
MSGGAASAVRAGAMALIAVYARATSRVFLAMRILGVVALVMVLWDPFTLAFDPSFQLSVLATLGLIAFTPWFAARLTWITERFGLREIAASTLATQTAVLPLLLYQSGQLSLYSLPANLLALIAVSPAMFASFAAAFAGVFLGPIAPFVALPAYLLLGYVIKVAEFFASLPFAALTVPPFSAWWLVPVYVCLLLFSWNIGSSGRAIVE